MQTVDHSFSLPIQPDAMASRRPDLHSMRRVRVTPVVPRRKPVPTSASLQAAEDGGEAEAHPS